MRGAGVPIRSVAFDGGGRQAMVLSADGTMREYRLFATLRDLVTHAAEALPRGLTQTQRLQFQLPSAANP